MSRHFYLYEENPWKDLQADTGRNVDANIYGMIKYPKQIDMMPIPEGDPHENYRCICCPDVGALHTAE